MPDNFSRTDLDTPSAGPRRRLIAYNDDAVGVGAEKVARFLGTGRYLMWQTIIVVIWICLNVGAFWWNWDPYPFILLNLAFSTQAAYAAPLILLAQNRQDDRDRVALNEDRRRAEETKADTEFLARDSPGYASRSAENVTRDYLRHELDDLGDLLRRIEDKLEDQRNDDRVDRADGATPDTGR